MKVNLTRGELNRLRAEVLSSILELTLKTRLKPRNIFPPRTISEYVRSLRSQSDYGKTIDERDIPLLLNSSIRRGLVNQFNSVNHFGESHHTYYRANLDREKEIRQQLEKYSR